MKLPNAENAVVAVEKLVDYLLNRDHVYGGPKANLLHAMGYSSQNWRHLEAEIRQGILDNDVAAGDSTAWGMRYEVVISLKSVQQQDVAFRTIWQINLGTDEPRLITMYPE